MKLDKSVKGANVTPRETVDYLFKAKNENSSTPNFTLRNLFFNEV